MPEVFAPPPEIVSGFMVDEVQRSLLEWNPLIAGIMIGRGLFGSAPRVMEHALGHTSSGPRDLYSRALGFLRRYFFDYFGRR
jgi:hypothetical protein